MELSVLRQKSIKMITSIAEWARAINIKQVKEMEIIITLELTMNHDSRIGNVWFRQAGLVSDMLLWNVVNVKTLTNASIYCRLARSGLW